MRIAFIGLGRVATALARGFERAGFRISPCYDVDPEKIEAWRGLDFPAAEIFEQVVNGADVIFVTTTDDAIGSVAERIRRMPKASGLKAVFHTSGAVPTTALAVLADLEVEYASVHPVMTFSGEIGDVDRLNSCEFCIEAGTEAGVELASRLFERLGGEIVMLTGEAKVPHHLACVLASNFTILLMDKARRVHEKAGVGTDASLTMLGRLARASIANSESLGPAAALTGPSVRGDVETIINHVRWLQANMPELLDIYVTLSRRTIELALRADRISQDQADGLKRVLSEADED
ncbi:MAG: DUF2520 domain-containing protein [Candidatus Coatesbacteria bacterium]|nr:DUF2520 domain-containing protein [Candidatus Coatesbacteria bacterium]